jgi:hypothetical protein
MKISSESLRRELSVCHVSRAQNSKLKFVETKTSNFEVSQSADSLKKLGGLMIYDIKRKLKDFEGYAKEKIGLKSCFYC